MQQMETLPPGTILHGRYRVERALGSGGFGHVYLSVDTQTNTQYAIKEYIVTGANGKIQLEHEAQVLSQLHHPNLPAYLTAFDERGHYYVVLGYIEGNDLTDYIRVVRQKNDVIPLARLMEWLLSICDAVTFLHSQRPPIIHRDIKPDNIRITPNGTATLVDLGNAKTAADGARTLFFIRHQGTPGYAPLEQYPGGSGTDERSDVYALGGTLYFALTAHEPPSVSTRNQSIQQRQPDLPTLQERLAQNPPDGSQEQRQFRLGVSKPAKPAPRHSRHLAQLGMIPPDLLRKLDAIIQRAMAMKPKDRYQSVADFSKDLRSVLKALPAATVPPVVKGRPVDPHSTQPDLPMLYEAMQNAQNQATQAQQQQQIQGQPVPSTPSPAQNVAVIRCPRCGNELSKPAPYCPRCGNPLTPPRNPAGGPGGADQDQARDLAAEATMVIPPRVAPNESKDQGYHPQPPAAPTSIATPGQSSVVSTRPPIQQSPSQPVPAVQTQVRTNYSGSGPDARPAGATPNIKTFLPASPQPPVSQITTPDTRSNTNIRRNIITMLIILIVVLLIVMLLLIVFLHRQKANAHDLYFAANQIRHTLAQSGVYE